MATITSLYLCNRTVYAAVGAANGRGVNVSALHQTELAEGCLINGMITNETDLLTGLQEFIETTGLPTRHVSLVLNSSQFANRVMNLPVMSESKRMAMLARELTANVGAMEEPLDDYMVLRRDKATRSDVVLATRVEKSVIDSMMHVAQETRLGVERIDLALAAQVKLVALSDELQSKTFLILQFDGDNLYAGLYVQGQYLYSTRSRLFHERGTAESGAEITQKISGLLQFHAAEKIESPITDVYMAGCTGEDLTVCTPGCQGLRLSLDYFPDLPQIHLPRGAHLADCMLTVGNLIQR